MCSVLYKLNQVVPLSPAIMHMEPVKPEVFTGLFYILFATFVQIKHTDKN